MKVLIYLMISLFTFNFNISCTAGKVFPKLEISGNSIEVDVLRYLGEIDKLTNMECQYTQPIVERINNSDTCSVLVYRKNCHKAQEKFDSLSIVFGGMCEMVFVIDLKTKKVVEGSINGY